MIEEAIRFFQQYLDQEHFWEHHSYTPGVNHQEHKQGVDSFLNTFVLDTLQLDYGNIRYPMFGGSDEEKMQFRSSVSKRNFYLAEEYASARFGSSLQLQNVSGPVVVAYTGSRKILLNSFVESRFFIARAGEDWKVVAIQDAVDCTEPRQGWAAFHLEDDPHDPYVSKLAKLKSRIKLLAPQDETCRKWFDSLKSIP